MSVPIHTAVFLADCTETVADAVAACAEASPASPAWLLVPLAVGAICFKAAANKGRNRWVWGVVGFFAPLVGLLFVLLLRRIRDEPAV